MFTDPIPVVMFLLLVLSLAGAFLAWGCLGLSNAIARNARMLDDVAKRVESLASRVDGFDAFMADDSWGNGVDDKLAALRSDHEKLDAHALRSVALLADQVFRQRDQIELVKHAIATNNVTIRGELERMADVTDKVGAELDEFRAADRFRRNRQSTLFAFAAAEVNGKDLSETFAMLAEDTYSVEVDGEIAAADGDDDDSDVAHARAYARAHAENGIGDDDDDSDLAD